MTNLVTTLRQLLGSRASFLIHSLSPSPINRRASDKSPAVRFRLRHPLPPLLVLPLLKWLRESVERRRRHSRRGFRAGLVKNPEQASSQQVIKGTVSSSFMEHFISWPTTTNLWFFSASGTGNAWNYINLMHQIRRIITVAQLNVCRRVLLDVRGIIRVLEVFVQLLGLKLAL